MQTHYLLAVLARRNRFFRYNMRAGSWKRNMNLFVSWDFSGKWTNSTSKTNTLFEKMLMLKNKNMSTAVCRFHQSLQDQWRLQDHEDCIVSSLNVFSFGQTWEPVEIDHRPTFCPKIYIHRPIEKRKKPVE